MLYCLGSLFLFIYNVVYFIFGLYMGCCIVFIRVIVLFILFVFVDVVVLVFGCSGV